MALSSNTGPTRAAGGVQALALIFALTLPITPLLSLMPNLPQLFAHFASIPHAEFLVPLIATMPSICIALLSPVSGVIADRLGRRKLLVIASAIFGIFGLLPFWLHSLYAVLACLFVVGAAEAFIMTCGNALLGDYFEPEARKRWLGVQAVLGSILATLILLAGGALGSISWHAPFLINLLGAVVFVWLLLFSWEPARTGNAPADGQSDPKASRFPWSAMLPIYGLSMLTGFFYYFQIELGVFFAHLGLRTPFQISLITTVASVGVIAGGWYVHQQRGRSVAFNVMLIYLTYGIGFLGVGLAGSYWPALPFAIVAQVGNGLFIPTFVGWALGTLDAQYRGRGMGIWMTSFFCAQFLSPTILTLIARSNGGRLLVAVAEIGAASLALTAIAALKLRRAPEAARAAD